MYYYTTKTKVAYLLGVEESVIQDEWLEWAEEELEERTQKVFREITVTNKRYDGTGSDELILDEYPITAITKIEYLYQYQPTEVWLELASTYYRLYTKNGIIKLTPDLSGLTDIDAFEEGVQNIRITYKYGYTVVPKIVELLATLLTAQKYQIYLDQVDGTISSERIGDYSVNFAVGNAEVKISDLIDKLVDQIKKTKFECRAL
jgi:hypothetical protein